VHFNKLNLRKLLVALFFVCSCIDGFSQYKSINESDSIRSDSSFLNSVSNLSEKVLDIVTWEKPRYTFAIIPAIGYSPRTQFEVGVMPIWRFKPRNTKQSSFYRPTTLAQTIQVSTSGMFEFGTDLIMFTPNRLFVVIDNQFLYLPDLYYGIGNTSKDTELFGFNSYKFHLKGEVLKGFTQQFFAGITYDFSYTQNRQSDALFFDSTVPGYQGGWTNGVGPALVADNRDNTLYPIKGSYLKMSALFYGQLLGSHYNFNSIVVDGRKYFNFGVRNNNIVATQMYLSIVNGDAPFYRLSPLGGKSAVRGVGHPNKYIDRGMWMVQSEYRRHIWWRLGLVGFAGVGNVYHTSSMILDNSHWFCGTGARFSVMNNEKLNLRLDYGIASRGDNALFFTLREAF
jgi:hypothetical protein